MNQQAGIEARAAATAGTSEPALTAGREALVGGVYIKQAAQMVGVTPTVIRAWEQQRLVTPQRTASGYRLYTLEAIERLRRIRALMQVEGLNAAGVRRELGVDGADGARSLDDPTSMIGPRLRLLRQQRGISLRQLAAETDLSASYISELERSLSTASVASLQQLAAALGTNMVKLLSDSSPDPERLVVSERDQRELPLDIPGVVIHELAAVDTQLEPLLFRVAPGGGSRESYAHQGEEFLYVLTGTLELTLEETATYHLQARDSMTFASHRPHRWWNSGSVETELLWVNTPPTF